MTTPLPRFVAYYRVSTDRQGRSGLGLDAQREAVAGQVQRAGGAIVADLTEIESGRRADRPELRVALAEAPNTRIHHRSGVRHSEHNVTARISPGPL